MPVFAVTTAKGANWDHARDIRQQPLWEQHVTFADEETLRSIFDADPWTVHRVFRIKNARSWTLCLDGRSRGQRGR